MFFSQIPTAVISILPLLIIAPILASFIKYTKWQFVLIVIMTLFIVTELVSIYFSGGFIDYQFFVNLNLRDIIAGLAIFKLQAALAILCFLVIVFVLMLISKFLRCYGWYWLRLSLLVIGIICLVQKEGPFSRLYEIYQVTMAQQKVFNQAIESLNMQGYVTKPALEAQKGKNIIVISLESFERGFMDMPGITPNLSRLSQQYTYFPDMKMGPGSSWTTASMYTYMTGTPFLIGELNTSPLANTAKIQLVSLGDILNKAGYQTEYVMGSPNFAGMGHIISLFGIEVISEANYPGKYPAAPFGLYDHDIFEVAKTQLTKFRENDKPFALFISTVSTHAPNGFEDERMRSLISPKADNMSFVAASLDYNLGRFIQYLSDNHILDNTVFYIFPDHLMMGAGTPIIATLSAHERSLYFMSNASTQALKKETQATLYQIDLPRLILNGAQVKTNATFLTDYIPADIDKLEYIKTHKAAIAQLNHSAEVVVK
ncbi:sulfatase-like hydrolase/transferase [Utexia brackfieldae]|uniref:LTA synthase family protein n=1 Tax=Utexia brackfieldae TaxID=3074108 RepID=UPI00370D5067